MELHKWCKDEIYKEPNNKDINIHRNNTREITAGNIYWIYSTARPYSWYMEFEGG